MNEGLTSVVNYENRYHNNCDLRMKLNSAVKWSTACFISPGILLGLFMTVEIVDVRVAYIRKLAFLGDGTT